MVGGSTVHTVLMMVMVLRLGRKKTGVDRCSPMRPDVFLGSEDEENSRNRKAAVGWQMSWSLP